MKLDDLTTVFKPIKDVTNTVNYKRLPKDYDQLDLQYRGEPRPAAQGVFALVAMVILGVVLTALSQLFSPTIAGWNAFPWAAGIFFFFFLGVVYLAKTRQGYRAVLIMLSGPPVCSMLLFLHPITNSVWARVLFLLAAVPVLGWFSDRVAKHYAAWMMANPRLSAAVRQRYEKAFASRFTIFPLPLSFSDLKLYARALRERLRSFRQACKWSLIKRLFLLFFPITKKGRQVYVDIYRYFRASGEQATEATSLLKVEERRRLAEAELRFYKFRFLYPLVVLIAFLPPSWYGGILSLVVPLAVVALFLLLLSTLGFSSRQMIRVTASAFASWFFYGRRLVDAPGWFQSPCGSHNRRMGVSVGIIVALTLALLPAVYYMPLAYEAGYQRLYANQFHKLRLDAESSYYEGRQSLAQRCGVNLYKGKPFRPFPEDPQSMARWRAEVEQWQRNIDYRVWLNEVHHGSFTDHKPEHWLELASMAVSDSDEVATLHLIIAVLGCLAFPVLILFSTCMVVAGPTLTLLYRAVESDGAYETQERAKWTPWSCYVKRLDESRNALEREHLWLGFHREDAYPVLLDKSILSEHAYIVGDSGSGKTALGITPLVTQLIRRTDDAVVIIDLKGDNALFQAVRKESDDAGRTFKWFTNELGRSTYVFNPFAQHEDDTNISINQMCETMLEALNLNHGEGYGRSFFSRVARRWLAGMLHKRPDIQSFQELYEVASKPENFSDEKEMRDAFELLAVIESLASFQQLNGGERVAAKESVRKNSIRMSQVIAEGQVVYFWLPSAAETATVREVAKLALYSLITSAYRHTRNTGKAKQSYLVIDEFQRIASDGFKLILQQARSMGVGAILANQTSADLKTHDTDLRPTVQTNTRFKWCFSATDLAQQDDIMKASGEAIYHLTSWSMTKSADSQSSTTSFRESVMPRISRNDVIRTSDDPFQSIVHVSRGSGYTQFSGFSIPVVVSHHITLKEYEERTSAEWPQEDENTIVTTRPPIDPDRYTSAEDRLHESKIMVDDETDAETPPSVHVVSTELPKTKKEKTSHYADMLDQLGANQEQDT